MKRILVIEDNSGIRENLVEYLQLSGFEILSANCGVLGVKLAKDYMPDLIICDILMPGMGGFEVLKELSGTKAHAIPIIFSTSKSEKNDLKEGIDLGAHDIIVKPYEMENLLEKIYSCLHFGRSQT